MRQGWAYLSSNFLCFHSIIMGKEFKLVVAWTDTVAIAKTTKLLVAEELCVKTRDDEVCGVWEYAVVCCSML